MEKELTLFSDAVPMIQTFKAIPKGSNILFDFGERIVLIKYEEGVFEALDEFQYRHNRYVTLGTFPPEFFLNEKERKTAIKRRLIDKKLQANIYGTHMLEFNLDPEFGIYLPSSSGSDLMMNIANKFRDGEIEKNEDTPLITMDAILIEEKLKKITRPNYYKEIIVPFLERKSTRFKIPNGNQSYFDRFFYSKKNYVQRRMTELPLELKHGDFLYVGCKEEVYLSGFVKRKAGDLTEKDCWNIGMSTKPIFYFSNNYLKFISKYDAEMPKFKGEGPVNVAKYRTYDIPEMGGKSFIFPQMGRYADCKNRILTGYPELITGNLEKALEHFSKTNFAEFSNIVEKYAHTMNFIHPSLEHIKNGSQYFH